MLQTGEQVAVKVQKPGVEKVLQAGAKLRESTSNCKNASARRAGPTWGLACATQNPGLKRQALRAGPTGRGGGWGGGKGWEGEGAQILVLRSYSFVSEEADLGFLFLAARTLEPTPQLRDLSELFQLEQTNRVAPYTVSVAAFGRLGLANATRSRFRDPRAAF